MTKFCKPFISLVLSGSLIFSSIGPAWADVSSSARPERTDVVINVSNFMRKLTNVQDSFENPRFSEKCQEIYNTNKGTHLSPREEGMFEAFCESWLGDQEHDCNAEGVYECSYFESENTIINGYKKEREELRKEVEKSFTETGDLANNLLYYLQDDQRLTCSALKRAGTSADVYTEILPAFLQESVIDQEGLKTYARLLRGKVSGKEKERPCFSGTDWDQERKSYVFLLGMIGSEKADAEALTAYIKEKDQPNEGGPDAGVILMAGMALADMGQYDVLGTVLKELFNKKRNDCPDRYDTLTVGGLTGAARERGRPIIGNKQGIEMACGWENSWFKDGDERWNNNVNAWAQLGQYIGWRASKGETGAQKLLNDTGLYTDFLKKGGNDKNPMFTLGVIISGYHPIYNKNNPDKTIALIQNVALNLMVNLDPPTRAYVRDGLFTIYTKIAGKSEEDAAKVKIYDSDSYASALVSALIVAPDPAAVGEAIANNKMYSGNGLYPARSKESNEIIRAEEVEEVVWETAKIEGTLVDIYMMLEGLPFAAVKVVGAFRQAVVWFKEAYRYRRLWQGLSKGRSFWQSIKALSQLEGTAALAKALSAWNKATRLAARTAFKFGARNKSLKGLIKAAKSAAKAERKMKESLQWLEEKNSLTALLQSEDAIKSLGTKTPAQLEKMLEEEGTLTGKKPLISDPETQIKLERFLEKVEQAAKGREGWKEMTVEQILKESKATGASSGAVPPNPAVENRVASTKPGGSGSSKPRILKKVKTGERLKVPSEYQNKTLKQLKKEARDLREQGKIAEAQKMEDYITEAEKFGLGSDSRPSDFYSGGGGAIQPEGMPGKITPEPPTGSSSAGSTIDASTVEEKVTAAAEKTVDDMIADVKSVGGIDAGVEGILRGNRHILAYLDDAYSVDRAVKTRILVFLKGASPSQITELNNLLKWKSNFALKVDARTLGFLANDLNGKELLTLLEKQGKISPKAATQIRAATSTSEGMAVWIVRNREGMQALTEVQKFLAERKNLNYLKQFWRSEYGKNAFLRDAGSVASDMKGVDVGTPEAQKIFRDQIEQRGPTGGPFYAKDGPGFPRYHLVNSGKGGTTYARLVPEREFQSVLDPIKVHAKTIPELEVELWGKAFDISSGRAEELAAALKKVRRKVEDIKSIYLRSGFGHELNASKGHLHTVIKFKDGCILTYTQDIKFGNSKPIEALSKAFRADDSATALGNIGYGEYAGDEAIFKSNIFDRPGTKYYEDRGEFIKRIKAAMQRD